MMTVGVTHRSDPVARAASGGMSIALTPHPYAVNVRIAAHRESTMRRSA